mgnify:CR=1 FL=1
MKQLLVLMVCLVLIAFVGCDDSEITAPDFSNTAGSTTSHSGCKSSGSGGSGDDETRDCVRWKYSYNGTLTVTHINSLHNCCPGPMNADITIGDGEIIIVESFENGCACSCLFDLEHQIVNLPEDVYELVVYGVNHIRLTIDLEEERSGEKCAG